MGQASSVDWVTGLPLIVCPRCGDVRLIALTCKNTKNRGKRFFKCPRNQEGVSWSCRTYFFQPEYEKYLQKHGYLDTDPDLSEARSFPLDVIPVLLKLKNLFGYCKTWDTLAALDLDHIAELGAGVEMPRIGARLHSRISFLSDNWFKCSLKEHILGVSVGLLSTMNHSLAYNLIWRNLTDPAHISSNSIQEHLARSFLASIKYAYKVDQMDSSIRPTRGYAFLSSSQVGRAAPGSKYPWCLRQEVDLRVAFPLGVLNGARNAGMASHGPGAETAEDQLFNPDDMLRHIHALMPMRYAAQAACVSHAFLRSWGSYPKLIFNTHTLALLETYPSSLSSLRFISIEEIHDLIDKGDFASIQEYYRRNNPAMRLFVARVDHIMRNHTGTGIAIFWVQPPRGLYIDPDILDRWFQAVIPQGITHFGVILDMDDDGLGYTFPCSLLSSDSKGCSTIASFTITGCRLGYIDRVGCLVSLRKLRIHEMRVTGDELCCFLSSSPALEELELSYCHDIVCLEVPHLLSKLRFLHVENCNGLQKIRCDAPNLKNFSYAGLPTTHISLGDSSSLVTEMKVCSVDEHGMLFYATTKLPSIAPNLSILSLSSCFEVAADTQMEVTKFRHLKYLRILLHTPSRCPDYDFYSLVSFLNACPALHTFILQLEMDDAAADAFPGDSHGDYSPQEKRRGGTGGECYHRKLNKVLISGFRPAKGLVELTSHILENATSLKQLVLDTAYGHNSGRCMCIPLTRNALTEARKAVDVIKRYIQGQVASSVEIKVIEPCIKCHTDEACKSRR